MRSKAIREVHYSCPACGLALVAEEGAADGWVRCPACARPSLPPEDAKVPIPNWVDEANAAGRSGSDLLLAREASRTVVGARMLGASVLVAAVVIGCLAIGRDPIEAAAIGIVLALAVIVHLRPRSPRRARRAVVRDGIGPEL